MAGLTVINNLVEPIELATAILDSSVVDSIDTIEAATAAANLAAATIATNTNLIVIQD
jgi:hypothetical protein